MKNHVEAGNAIFYDIYTDEEKAADPAKENTGLFFFKETPGERFAICNAGGGEAMSIVMGKRPELFTAYLHCSSRWNGDYEVLAANRIPVYLAIGRNDEYYGSDPTH